MKQIDWLFIVTAFLGYSVLNGFFSFLSKRISKHDSIKKYSSLIKGLFFATLLGIFTNFEPAIKPFSAFDILLLAIPLSTAFYLETTHKKKKHGDGSNASKMKVVTK